MKRLLTIICLLFGASVYAQKLQINYGLAKQNGVPSIAAEILKAKFDTSIAFTSEGFWRSNQIDYSFIAVKGKRYYKGTIRVKRIPKAGWERAVFESVRIDTKKAKSLFKYINNSGLWALSCDSLNYQKVKNQHGELEEMTLHDADNNIFERITKADFMMIEAYAPEIFLEEYHLDKGRKEFIKVRDWFLSRYHTL